MTKWWNDVYKINIDRKQKNRSPPSQNILNIFLSQRHLIIARLNVRWLLTQIISLQRVDLLKKRQDLLTNQSVSGGHIYLLPTKSSVSAISVNLTIFLDDFFFVSVGNFAQFWKYQTIWYAFPTVFSIRVLQYVVKNSSSLCFFWSPPPIWRFFWRFLMIFLTIFFPKVAAILLSRVRRYWRNFQKICAARRHPRKIQANGTLQRSLPLFRII